MKIIYIEVQSLGHVWVCYHSWVVMNNPSRTLLSLHTIETCTHRNTQKYLPSGKGTRESIYVHPGEPCSLDILPEKIELVVVYEHE